ncbi:hypothetical protein HPP92_002687 [Vanilla planifolia]|uniref:Uncharacterized protein n=1 Tax=Vanilla planifolia TaxID=51239 RepID=A0A835VIQ6_VANPL|nr:hypothetical protein HPP92_002687 [Vanilla planifolia]
MVSVLLILVVNLITADRSERSKDQEILANILRNIASLCGSSSDTPRKDAVAPTSGAPNVEGNNNTLCSPARTISATSMANNCGIDFDVALSEFHHQKRFLGSAFSKTMQHFGRLVHEEDQLHSLSEKLRLWRHMLPAACTADSLRTKGFDLNTVCDEEQHGIARS